MEDVDSESAVIHHGDPPIINPFDAIHRLRQLRLILLGLGIPSAVPLLKERINFWMQCIDYSSKSWLASHPIKAGSWSAIADNFVFAFVPLCNLHSLRQHSPYSIKCKHGSVIMILLAGKDFLLCLRIQALYVNSVFRSHHILQGAGFHT